MKKVKICRCSCKGADLNSLAPLLKNQLSVTIHFPRMRICFCKNPLKDKDNVLLFFAVPQNFTDTCISYRCCLVFPDKDLANRFLFSDDLLKVARRLRTKRKTKYILI